MRIAGSSYGGHSQGWLAAVSPMLAPLIASASLYAFSWLWGVVPDEPLSVLAVIVFLLTFFVYREVASASATVPRRPRDFLQWSVTSWAITIAILAILGFALKASTYYSRIALFSWALATPLIIAGLQFGLYVWTIHHGTTKRTAVIAGVSELSQRLAEAISEFPGHGVQIAGWFEDRGEDRIGQLRHGTLLGKLSSLPEYVKQHSVDIIYIALPIRHEERTKKLLDELQDTTISIYFVPDIFVFDLIQSRVDSVNGIPLLALCETPFFGINGLVKRVTDLTISLTMLILLSPVLLAVAFGVAITTRGSIIFKQRRYGLDGCEIVVYKFRSMTSSDDADHIPQAQQDDTRTTRFGRFIRRYSLDELPQLVNVLQGRMSLVGPRPHAVAHNEEYRGLIKGYMIRHKVAPGITGLAQVRGHRGETKTVDQMQARIECDLEYLRRWSLWLDLKILWLTAVRVFNDSKAF